jgi:hypothetical protein
VHSTKLKMAHADHSPDLILAVAIMACLCLFWGALFRQNDNVKNLKILVVDFDGQVAPYTGMAPFVGPFVTEAVDNMTKAGGIAPAYIFKKRCMTCTSGLQ